MSRYGSYPIAAVLLVWLAGNFALAGEQGTPAQSAAFYSQCIDAAICKCDNKRDFRDSKLNTIRRAAALAVMKSAYLRHYRSHLIDEMLENQVPLQTHSVEHYINHRFLETVH